MSGVSGLGSRSLSAHSTPQAHALAGDLDHLGLQVTPDNILGARNVLRGEAARLRLLTQTHLFRLTMVAHSPDPVSTAATPLFQAKIDGLKAEWDDYCNRLDEAGVHLEEVALAYGHSEQQVTDSFNDYLDDQTPGWTGQSQVRDAEQDFPEPVRALFTPGATAPSTEPPALPLGPW